ncbi:MAG: hypothetical protein IKM01_02440 [Clostridia bacterium]|nr:hypothetical protein [Clostridia bacterium]
METTKKETMNKKESVSESARKETQTTKCAPCEERKKESSSKELYQEIYRGARMGIDSIEAIKNEVCDKKLRTLIGRQQRAYSTLAKEAEEGAFSLGADLKATSMFNKMMVYASIKLKTVLDRRESHLAEMLVQGTNMGIIAITKALNRVEDGVDTILAEELLSQYKTNLEDLKAYL